MTEPTSNIPLTPRNLPELANPAGDSMRVIDSQALFTRAGENEVIIQHQGQLYRLRITRSGKLILTK